MLVECFYQFGYQAKTWFLMIFYFFYGNVNRYGIPDKNWFSESQTVISISHGHVIYKIGSKSYSDRKDQGAMCDPFTEGLGFAPFFIHMMREEIACLTGMYYNISLCNGAAPRAANSIELKFLEKFPNKHGSQLNPVV